MSDPNQIRRTLDREYFIPACQVKKAIIDYLKLQDLPYPKETDLSISWNGPGDITVKFTEIDNLKVKP